MGCRVSYRDHGEEATTALPSFFNYHLEEGPVVKKDSIPKCALMAQAIRRAIRLPIHLILER